MSKANRKKHLQHLQKATLQKYGQVKLADAITHLCKPFASDKLDFDSHHNLMALGVAAWNIALSANIEDRKANLVSVLETLPEFGQPFEPDTNVFFDIQPLMQGSSESIMKCCLVAELMKRKDELYPNDERHIVDFTFKPTPKGVHLQIKSLIPKRSGG